MAWASCNRIVCALRLRYGVTLARAEMPARIASAREPRKRPVVLSAGEAVRLLAAVPGRKSRAALTAADAAGLRVAEVVALKNRDLESKRMAIRIARATGGKQRYTMLATQLLRILRTDWRLARPRHWLFPGRDPRHPIDRTVLHAACRSARPAAGLAKPVTVHSLRHSLATHLLANGTDIRVIQVLLGHNNLSTTARSTQVSTGTIQNTASPPDRLDLEIVAPTEAADVRGALEVADIRRFLPHAWPDGLQRMRHYGLLANSHRADKLALCRKPLATPAPPAQRPIDYRARYRQRTGQSLEICPCRGGRMQPVARMPPIDPTRPKWRDRS
jgi:integrase/recombinase XerD